MNFYWVGLIYWLLIVTSVSSLIFGLWKKSWKILICSGILLILPSLYFGGAENWLRLFIISPLIPFILAYYARDKD